MLGRFTETMTALRAAVSFHGDPATKRNLSNWTSARYSSKIDLDIMCSPFARDINFSTDKGINGMDIKDLTQEICIRLLSCYLVDLVLVLIREIRFLINFAAPYLNDNK